MGDSKKPFDKKKIIKLHLSEGRSRKSLENEYNLGNGTVAKWINSYRKECQNNIEKHKELDYYADNLRLKKQNEELLKENLFLKKVTAFFAKQADK